MMRRLLGFFLVLAVVLGGCGQKTGSHGGVGNGPAHGGSIAAGTRLLPLPPECAGDAEHCVAVTSYEGVHVYRNFGPGGFCTEDGRCDRPSNQYGLRWQCVELFNRFFALRFGTEHVPGDARDLYANAMRIPGLEVHPNGGPVAPVPGDALVFDDNPYGHVAIVTGVGDGALNVVEQNVPGDGTNRYRYDGATNRVLSGPSARAEPVGWIHAAANHGAH